jgi:hypothetical protein
MIFQQPKETRFELKFVTDATHYRMWRHWIMVHPSGFRVAYPTRQINNIYFDTYDLSSYQDNLLGGSARLKLRYRWYGENREPGPGLLELKCKRNLLGWKLKHSIDPFPNSNGKNWHKIKSQIRCRLPQEWRVLFDSYPQAVLINRYIREYFVSLDGKVMLNLDLQHRFFNQYHKIKPNFVSKENARDVVVLEVKSARKQYEVVPTLMKTLPIRVSRHSKYVVGVNTTRWGS